MIIEVTLKGTILDSFYDLPNALRTIPNQQAHLTTRQYVTDHVKHFRMAVSRYSSVSDLNRVEILFIHSLVIRHGNWPRISVGKKKCPPQTIKQSAQIRM